MDISLSTLKRGQSYRLYGDPIFTTSLTIIIGSAALIGLFLIISITSDIKAALPVMNYIDKQAMLFLNFTGSHATDNFWYEYSQKTTWIPLIITVFLCTIKTHPGTARDKIIFVSAVTLIIIIIDQLSSGVIKPLIGRLRPSHDPTIMYLLHYVIQYHGGLHGFVSSHAAINVGIATMMCMIYKDRFTRVTLVLFAALMCYSRIYLGVHYPGDVLAGGLLGWSISFFAFKKLGRFIRVYSTPEQPSILLLTFYATLLCIII